MKTGIFGGTFDPIHNAHLRVAESVRELAGLDRILFVPTGNPPYRATYAPVQARAEMVRLALAGHTDFELDTTELELPEPVYTADAIRALRAKYPNDELFFIAGADSLAKTPWRRLDEVAEQLQRFIIVGRPGVADQSVDDVLKSVPAALRSRFARVDLAPIDISASEIRARVREGKSISRLTPPAVAEYIEKNGLYRS